MLSSSPPKPLVLAILDGWGHRVEKADNAVAQAHIPFWDQLLRDYPNGVINASELHVGLPEGQMGNSEVGHMNIGSGRVLMQDLPRIDAAFADGSLERNARFIEFVATLKKKTNICHVLGLLSPGGVHSHENHIIMMAKLLAKNGLQVHIHAFLDGRDTPPQSALAYIKNLEDQLAHLPEARIATLCGRYYAMDRDKRWDRVQKAYETLTQGQGERFKTAKEAIEKSYLAGMSDEFLLPCVIDNFSAMQEGDGLIMANFRSDRVRELLSTLLDPNFKEFARPAMHFGATLGMSEYSAHLNAFIKPLFPPQPLTHIFGEVISQAGLRQLRIAETEKYAHVTFFFNGGREEEFPGEERILIPSPAVATYDLKPEMAAYEITDALLAAIASERFDVIIVNYANGDMVGHTGNIKAAIQAVEVIDACLKKLTQAVLAKGGALLITADHGNAEMMFDHHTEQAHTAHTLNLVPAVIVAERFKGKHIAIREGKLGDIAPTLLQLLRIDQPAEMTGRSLLEP